MSSKYIVKSLNPFESRYEDHIIENIGNFEITKEGCLLIWSREDENDGKVLRKAFNKEHWFNIEFVQGEDTQEETHESEAEDNPEGS